MNRNLLAAAVGLVGVVACADERGIALDIGGASDGAAVDLGRASDGASDLAAADHRGIASDIGGASDGVAVDLGRANDGASDLAAADHSRPDAASVDAPLPDGLWTADRALSDASPPDRAPVDLARPDVGMAKPTTAWVTVGAGPDRERAYDVAVDPSGAAYVAGEFPATLNWTGLSGVPSCGCNTSFVARLSSAGTPGWVLTPGGVGLNKSSANAVVAHSGGAVLVGIFNRKPVYGATTLSARGETDAFVARVTSSGGYAWAVSAGGTEEDRADAVTVDSAGNIYVAGKFKKTATFGTTTLTSAGGSDLFVARLNAAGVFQWAVRAGGTGMDEYSTAVAALGGGDIALAGRFQGKATFGGTTLTGAGKWDMVVARLDGKTGAFRWAKGAAVDSGPAPKSPALASGPSGSVLVSAGFTGTVDVGGQRRKAAGSRDTLVARFDTAGAVQWVTAVGDKGASVDGHDLVVEGQGGVVVVGSLTGSATLAGAKLKAAGSRDVLVVGLSAGGVVAWAESAGGASADLATSVSRHAGGALLVAGTFAGTARFGTHTVKAQALDDIFVWKLN